MRAAGITECQIIQWFVQPGARVEQFDKICEVQSDKASVEITSRFDGIIKKLHYEKDDVARVGKPLLDIDIQGEISKEDEKVIDTSASAEGDASNSEPTAQEETRRAAEAKAESHPAEKGGETSPQQHRGGAATLATPAVRRITKELNINIADVPGSGKDGRVLKEDVQKFASSQQAHGQQEQPQSAQAPPSVPEVLAEDKAMPLTGVQSAMFKTMTRSLSIPHFLYTDTVDFSSLNAMRRKLNSRGNANSSSKISGLPFIIKAVSQALISFPSINAHLDSSNSDKPLVTQKAAHNIGVAIDSPSGLLVPVIRNVQNHSIASLAAEIARLASLAQSGKLTSADFQGATFTVSNIGSIGGTVVAPVIVSPQIAILGVGKARAVPAFDADGGLVRKEECVFSWSADHRVVDGATVARCAELVRKNLEDLGEMMVNMR